jgi:membrane protein implicated in regulation of membrane protease activity
MRRYSGPWWASLLLSSAVTGGGSFALLTLLAGLPVETAILISVALIVLGDIVLAFIMESISPTHVMLAPGERRHRNDIAEEFGTVIGDFEGGAGRVSIRGEHWCARQSVGCHAQLKAGSPVRILERNGLTLVVAAA